MSAALFSLSLDIDWAADEVIADTLGLVAASGVRATWFVTHPSSVLRDIAATPGQELGLHPNFNPLLDGIGAGTAREVLLRLRDCAPNAVSVRSHSLTRSTRLADLFVTQGLTHESNFVIPPSLGHALKPWRDFQGLMQVPIRWEDDVRLVDASFGEPREFVGQIDAFVVDFHPVHVFVNTASMFDYERIRSHQKDAAFLRDHSRPLGSGGSRDRLLALLDTVRASGIPDILISEFSPSAGT